MSENTPTEIIPTTNASEEYVESNYLLTSDGTNPKFGNVEIPVLLRTRESKKKGTRVIGVPELKTIEDVKEFFDGLSQLDKVTEEIVVAWINRELVIPFGSECSDGAIKVVGKDEKGEPLLDSDVNAYIEGAKEAILPSSRVSGATKEKELAMRFQEIATPLNDLLMKQVSGKALTPEEAARFPVLSLEFTDLRTKMAAIAAAKEARRTKKETKAKDAAKK